MPLYIFLLYNIYHLCFTCIDFYDLSAWSSCWFVICPSSDGTYYGMVEWWCPSGRFPHFSPTPFDIWSWNFAHDFVLMYYRSSLSVVTLRQFLKELYPFENLEYRKCEVFRIFLLHALTYWAEILHRTLFYCTTDQVRVSSICVYFWRSYASFWT